MPRPPLQAARKAATKRLIERYQDDYDELVASELASAGWSQQEVTQTKWVSKAVPQKPE